MNLAVLIIVIIFASIIWVVTDGKTIEKYTDQDNELAKRLYEEFTLGNIPTFTKYLTTLVELQNTNDNLISKGVYNRLLKKDGLSAQDILKEMSEK